MKLLLLPALLALSAISFADETHQWTARNGQTFAGALVAADAVRVTLDVAGRGKVTVLQSVFSPADLAYLQQWRRQNPHAPLVDPAALAPWPAQAQSVGVNVQESPSDGGKGGAWESAYYRFSSDSKVGTGVVRDLATLLEATRAALIDCPLGLLSGTEKERYSVRMFGRPVDYLFNGGMAGTGARFNGKELLLNVSDLGIKATSNGFGAEQMKMLFFIKREAARQLLHGEGWQLPVWLDEGLGECVASWPYAQGRYSLQNLDAAMGDHLAKARKPADRKPFHLLTPAKLMPLPWDQWRELDPAETAASAGLFVQYGLFHDGKGDGAGLAAYLDALRRGTAEPEAEAKFLLRGRKREDLAEEMRKLAQHLVPDAVLE